MKSFSEETRKRMSEAARKRCSQEWRKKKSSLMETQLDTNYIRSLYEAGASQSEIACILQVSQKVIWRHMKNHGIPARKAAKRYQWQDENSAWKGNNASYKAFHSRIYSLRGRAKDYPCSICGTDDKSKTYDWANLSGDYGNVYDYAPMCGQCHRQYDKKNRLKEGDSHV